MILNDQSLQTGNSVAEREEIKPVILTGFVNMGNQVQHHSNVRVTVVGKLLLRGDSDIQYCVYFTWSHQILICVIYMCVGSLVVILTFEGKLKTLNTQSHTVELVFAGRIIQVYSALPFRASIQCVFVEMTHSHTHIQVMRRNPNTHTHSLSWCNAPPVALAKHREL